MKSPQTPQNSQVTKEESKTQLQEKLEILEKEWSTIKQHLPNPNLKKPNSFRRRSILHSNIPILECSPRRLMSSLQHKIDDDVAGDEEGDVVIRKEIRRFDVGIKGKKLQFEDEGPPAVGSEVCSSGSCLDVISESVDYVKEEGYRGRSRLMMIAWVCIVIALMGCVLGSVRFRFCSFGFGEEEIVLVPT